MKFIAIFFAGALASGVVHGDEWAIALAKGLGLAAFSIGALVAAALVALSRLPEQPQERPQGDRSTHS